MEPEGSLPHSQVSATCPYPESARSSPYPQPTSWRLNLILSSHLRQGFSSGPFPPGVSSKWPLFFRFTYQNPVYTSTLPIRATCPAHLILLDLITGTILGDEYRSLRSLCSCLHSRYLVPLRPKYSPQHPVLRHPQPTFLPQSQRPSFTPIPNNRQNYSS